MPNSDDNAADKAAHEAPAAEHPAVIMPVIRDVEPENILDHPEAFQSGRKLFEDLLFYFEDVS